MLAFWNIRGCRRKNALVEVKDFCDTSGVKICMICEVKSQIPPSLTCIRKCGFHYFDFIPTMGMSGGLWLMWKDCNQNPFILNVVFKSQRFIAVQIELLNLQFIFMAIFVCAPAQASHKAAFWEEIILYVNNLSCPFIIVGDFNELSCIEDKQGGAPFHYSRLNIMNNLFNQVTCAEVPFIGPRFTWRQSASSTNNLYERLDKGVASLDWLAKFPQARCKHSIFTSSDHCHVILDFFTEKHV